MRNSSSKFASMLLFVWLFFVMVTTGGCGGGGGDDGYDYDRDPDTPIEEPVEPEEPTSPDQPVPPKPESPDLPPASDDVEIPTPEELQDPAFWIKRLDNPDKVLYTASNIKWINRTIRGYRSAGLVDLENVTEFEKSKFRSFYGDGLYLDGSWVEEEKMIEYYEKSRTIFDSPRYAIIVKRSNMRFWPEDRFMAFGPDSSEDILQVTCLEVGTPVLVTEVCVFDDGTEFFYSIGEKKSGWINANNVAVFTSKEDWLKAWQFGEDDGRDFLVVTQDKIVLDPSRFEPELPKLEIGLGTRLEVATYQDEPESYGDRSTGLPNHIVRIPARENDSGEASVKFALIPEKKFNLSKGYLPVTQANLITVTLQMLQAKYTWNSLDGGYDDERLIERIFSCFGINLPIEISSTNTFPMWQDFSESMTAKEKISRISEMTSGTVLRTSSGVPMVYIGTFDDKAYVVAAVPWLVSRDANGKANVTRTAKISMLTISDNDEDESLAANEIESVLEFPMF